MAEGHCKDQRTGPLGSSFLPVIKSAGGRLNLHHLTLRMAHSGPVKDKLYQLKRK